jgi:adenosine kinase
VEDTYTAQAMIMTDSDNNQITAFHPGAMMQAHCVQVKPGGDIRLGMISPDGRDAMLQHAQQFNAAGIPFVFDPGQGLPMFDGKELANFIDLATWVTVNDYEGKMLSERTGWSSAEISRRVQGLVVTLGGDGCEVWVNGEVTLVPPEQAKAIVDPTGCGDAWRGALLYGLEQGWTLARCAQLGNKVGAIKIASRGPQNYTLTGLKH